MKTRIFIITCSLLVICNGLFAQSPIEIVLTVNHVTPSNLNDGSIITSVSSGTPPYIYNWSNGSSEDKLTNLPMGNYSLTITDDAGNSKTSIAEVGYQAIWENKVNVVTNDKEVVKTASNGWNAGMSSKNLLPANETGKVVYTVRSFPIQFMIGLSNEEVNVNYNTIDFAFFLNVNKLKIFENGVKKMDVPVNIALGEVFEIARETNSFVYYRNGVEIMNTPFNNTNNLSHSMIVDVSVKKTQPFVLDGYTDFGFSDSPATSAYGLLKRKLDGGYYTTVSGKLQFKFLENYAVENNSATIDYSITKWDQTEMLVNTVLPVTHGRNYIQLDLNNNGFAENEFYVLNVTGNKGENYFLRFQYKQ